MNDQIRQICEDTYGKLFTEAQTEKSEMTSWAIDKLQYLNTGVEFYAAIQLYFEQELANYDSQVKPGSLSDFVGLVSWGWLLYC